MTSRVGKFLITSEGIFSVKCEGRFKGYDVIQWWGRLGPYKSVKCFASLEVSKESIVDSF